MTRKRQHTTFAPERTLAFVPGVCVDDSGSTVALVIPQTHAIQRLFRKLGARIPQAKRLALDELGAFVCQAIAQETTVGDLAQALKAAFGDRVEPLHERLFMYLDTLQSDLRVLRRDTQ